MMQDRAAALREPEGNPGLFLKCSRNSPHRGGEQNVDARHGEKKRGEKLCYRRQDEGTRILFKAEHFTAVRFSGGNGGSPGHPRGINSGLKPGPRAHIPADIESLARKC